MSVSGEAQVSPGGGISTGMTPLLAQGLRPDRSFERIYHRHAGDVYRYALAVLRNSADAEDVTQTTFMNAYRAYAGGERPRQPQNWLIAIAHNVCRQRFRQSQRRPQEVAFDDNVGDWLEEEDRGPTADDLRRALSHLAFNQRAALVMRELEGRSYNEIAEILGLTVAAVETLLFRARRALREQLEGALTCDEAERALSLEADGRLPRSEKGPLRAHLRECKDCAAAARRQRAQRSAWKALGALPLPASLSSLFGGGGAAIGVKAAAVAASAIAAGGIGVAGERHFTATHPAKAKRHPVARPVAATDKPAVLTPAAASPARVFRVVRNPAPVVAAKHHGQSRGKTTEAAPQQHGNSQQAHEQHQPRLPQPQKRGQGQGNGRAVSHAKQKQSSSGNGNGQHKARGHDAPAPTQPQPQSKRGGGTGHGRSNGTATTTQGQGNGHGKGASLPVDLPQLPLPLVPADLPKTPGN
jgi:RNA polymerase sigma factor (sigma-70 family)